MFCSRELETGLTEYVRREVARSGFPADDALRERARQIMAMARTSCDDPVLLERFKASVKAGLADPGGAGGAGTGATCTMDLAAMAGPLTPGVAADIAAVSGAASAPMVSDAALATLPAEMDVDFHFTEQEMQDILQEVSPDFGTDALLNLSPTNSNTGSGFGG